EVFAASGFDAMLGNPPWEVQQFSDDEFFSICAPQIAEKSGADRKRAISELETTSLPLWQLYQQNRNLTDNLNGFCRHSKRYSLSIIGKLNTFALFIESILNLLRRDGR